MDELKRSDFIPKWTWIGAAREARIAEMVDGDFNSDGPIEGELEDGEDVASGGVMSNMVLSELAGLKAWLAGTDGQPGYLTGIKEDLAELTVGQHQIEEKISTIIRTQIEDRSDMEGRIEKVKLDLHNIGGIARGARDGLNAHMKDVKKKEEAKALRLDADKKWSVEQWIKVVAIAGPFIGSGATLLVSYLIGG